MFTRKKIIYLASMASMMMSMPAEAQQSAIYADNIKTLQLKVNGLWGEPPVMNLGGYNRIEISFDDMQHSYVRYVYKLVHCNADWTESDIFDSDYVNGFNEGIIDNYEQSVNTQMLYNHYTLEIPNDEMQPKISGNYKLYVYVDGEEEPVLQACFSLLEPHVGVSASISANTDIDTYSSHQQVSMIINYANYLVSSPQTEFKPVVYQNRRPDNFICGIMPSYISGRELKYEHNRQLIFDAGNEYRRFEILDPYVPTMHVYEMEFFDPYYHATLYEDAQRRNYIYDEDQDGRFLIRNDDNINNDTESDYFYTHFKLKMPRIGGGDVYLNGDLTYNQFAPQYKMKYNEIDKAYEIVVPLKQGSYNYQYMFVSDDGSKTSLSPTEGNFHQTENEYTIYVYHRPVGGRYDKLVGFKQIIFKQN